MSWRFNIAHRCVHSRECIHLFEEKKLLKIKIESIYDMTSSSLLQCYMCSNNTAFSFNAVRVNIFIYRR